MSSPTRRLARSTKICGRACLAAIACDPADCRRHAETFTGSRGAAQFLATLQPIPREVWRPMKRRALPDATASQGG